VELASCSGIEPTVGQSMKEMAQILPFTRFYMHNAIDIYRYNELKL